MYFSAADLVNSAQIPCKISDGAVFRAVNRMRISPVETGFVAKFTTKKKIKSRVLENGLKSDQKVTKIVATETAAHVCSALRVWGEKRWVSGYDDSKLFFYFFSKVVKRNKN